MTGVSESFLHIDVLGVRCPACQREAGSWCVDSWGRRRWPQHQARFDLAERENATNRAEQTPRRAAREGRRWTP